MSTLFMQKKVEDRASLSDLIDGVLDKAAKANRDPSKDEQAQLDEWVGRCAKLDDDIAKLEAQARGNRNFEQIIGRIGRDQEAQEISGRKAREKDAPPVETRSAGKQFVESEEFKAFGGGVSSRKVEFGGFLEQRAAISTAELSIPAHQWSGPSEPSFASPLLNVIGREVVSSGNVEYISWSDVSEAEEVAEGALKPEATLTPTEENVPLKTYAHWKAITRQALEDLPRIQSIVDSKLRRGLAKKLESVATSVLIAETGFTPVAAEDMFKGIRVAVGEVQGNGYDPNAVLLNPLDFAEMDINTANDSNNGPNGFATYWGVRPVPVPGIPSGTSFVGDFKEALTWFDRNKTAVYLTDSHADYFIRNLLVVLAETRAAFAATNPEAAAKVTTPPVVPFTVSSAKK